jgi:hypothetical protein
MSDVTRAALLLTEQPRHLEELRNFALEQSDDAICECAAMLERESAQSGTLSRDTSLVGAESNTSPPSFSELEAARPAEALDDPVDALRERGLK